LRDQVCSRFCSNEGLFLSSALKEKRGFDELFKYVLAEIEKDDKK